MILDCNFEELQALASGAEMVLSGDAGESGGSVAAPAEAIARVAALQARLGGDLEIETLAEQREARLAVRAICDELQERMDASILEYHPAHEESVALYFDYAHAYKVLDRLEDMGDEMTALIELMTGDEPTPETARRVTFGGE